MSENEERKDFVRLVNQLIVKSETSLIWAGGGLHWPDSYFYNRIKEEIFNNEKYRRGGNIEKSENAVMICWLSEENGDSYEFIDGERIGGMIFWNREYYKFVFLDGVNL